jgi:hypothetical protein
MGVLFYVPSYYKIRIIIRIIINNENMNYCSEKFIDVHYLARIRINAYTINDKTHNTAVLITINL